MKQVTAVLIGAGLRGCDAYGSYALWHPDEFRITAVAEPDEERKKRAAGLFNIAPENQFDSYEELLSQKKMADCAMICTQDHMHYEPVIRALKLGYHVLCEKPMSPDQKEIIRMEEAAKRYGKALSICHVLRYSPFFVRLKVMLDEGRIGRLVSIQHIEEVGYWHHAHSFVRGNWRNAKASSPMILAKCCHDMDILLWLIESQCSAVSSFGDLSYFREENAPEGAPAYCMDGCPHRDGCPYYAPRFYLEHPRAGIDNLVQAVSQDNSPEAVLERLKKGPYGRCVFHCDNTVVDHQTVNLTFENGVDVSFQMSAFTKNCRRVLNLMGTHGQITGDMDKGEIVLSDFVTGNTETVQLNTPDRGHNGSDEAMMKNFAALVAADGKINTRSSASASVDSHLLALAAEEARLTGRVIHFPKYKEELERQCKEGAE